MHSKKFWRSLFIGLCAVTILITTIFSSSIASASYVDDYADNAQELELIRMLYEAASRCMESPERNTFYLDLSVRASGTDRKIMHAYNLNNGMFDSGRGISGANLIYSATLENMTSGYDDGKLYCSEPNLLPDLLLKLGQYTTDVRNKLICNNSEPGIFSIKSGYRSGYEFLSTRPEGAPAQDDCIGNFNMMIDYIENRPTERIDMKSTGAGDYHFYVIMAPTANAADHFQDIVGPMVGTFPGRKEIREAMRYWRYYRAFESGCSTISSGSEKAPAQTSSNMVAIYDAASGKIFYHDKTSINPNRTIYYDIDGDESMTCADLAGKLSGENANDLAFSIQSAGIPSCIDDYKKNLKEHEERLRDYRWQQLSAKTLMTSIKKNSEAIRSGELQPTVHEGDYGEPVTEYVNLDAYANNTLNSYQEVFSKGIGGQQVYNYKLLKTMINAFKEIVANTVVSADRITIDEKPDDVTFEEFNKLLDEWQKEIDSIESEINQAQNLLNKKQEILDKDNNSMRGEVWEFDDDKLELVCVGLQKNNEEFAEILEAPANPDISWVGVVITHPDGTPGQGDISAGLLDGCSGNAGALGWILCPVLRILGEATDAMFTIVAENYLSIDSAAIENRGMDNAWRTFQTFANIIFVIFLIFVILSQVTGFGISNYGIKKVLPRLIVTVILVNLSFIICTIAADLSNIAGSGLDELFRNIEIGSQYTADFNFGSFIWHTISSIGTVGTPLILGGVALGITIADGGWGVLLMPILLAAIVGFISILFFYVLLAVRKAGIYILIAISPIAIVCYMLPNTQKLFNRWLKMFSSLLLVYPICGVLMGGGNFASRLLLITASSSSGFIYYLVCMLLSVVPFFFIPTLLKNSMSVLGSIGGKIANMGSKWSNMATGALRRSRWAQDHQQEIARNIDMKRSKRLLTKNQGVLDRLNKKRTNPGENGNLEGLSAKEKKRYQQAAFRKARAADTQNRRKMEEINAANIAEYFDKEMLDNQEASARRKFYENMVSSFADGTISSNTYKRSDGTTGAVDYNDPTDIEKALINLAQDVENNPDDKLAMVRMEGMMEVAKRKGAKGRRAIVNALRETEKNGGSGKGSAANRIANRLMLDDKTMGALHSFDSGTELYVQDLASGNGTKPIYDYAMQTIESMKLDNVGDLEDTFQDNLKGMYEEIDDLRKSGNDPIKLQKLEASYQKAVNTMVQAASDPRYAGKIKSKDAKDFINKHAKQMYEIERDNWLKDANNLSQLNLTDANGNTLTKEEAYSRQIKAYKDVELGRGQDELKILRRRDMPANIEIDPAQNAYRMKQADGSYRDLTPDEQRVVDKIIDYNASVDIQNQGK